MRLPRLAVGRPVAVTMAVFALLLFAVIAFNSIGFDLLPRIDYPIISVITVFPNADPATVEAEVTRPLEDAIANLAGLRRLRSISMENASLIMAEIQWGTNLSDAVRRMETNVQAASYLLPQGVERPMVVQIDPSEFPVMLIAVSGDEEGVSLTERVSRHVIPRLSRVQDVASVQLLGGDYEEIVIHYDSQALEQYNLTPTLLFQILATQNIVVPSGTLVEDQTRFRLRAGNEIDGMEGLRNQAVGLRAPEASVGFLALASGLPVRLHEVADISIQPQKREGATLVNGEPALLLRVQKRSNTNTVTVSNEVSQVLAELEKEPELGLSFVTLSDQAQFIRNSLGDLAQAAAYGGIFALLVLFVFLRRLAPLAVIAISIPLSLTAAIVILYAFDITLNLMSLGGLAMGIGLLVDNAIVVLESINRHRELGKDALSAAIDGSGEIAQAISVSTFSTLVVFLPVVFLSGLAGSILSDLAIAVSATLIASLVASLTVVPAAAAKGFQIRDRGKEPSSTPMHIGSLHRAYQRALNVWLDRKWASPLAIVVFGALLVYLPTQLGAQFLPPIDGGSVYIDLRLPAGTPLEKTRKLVAEFEEQILALPDVDTVVTTMGDQGGSDFLSLLNHTEVHEVSMTAVLHPREKRRMSAAQIEHVIASIPRDPQMQMTIQSDRASVALGDDFFPGITLDLTGPDLNVLEDLASRASSALQNKPGIRSVSNNVGEGQPELFMHVTERSFQGLLAGGEPLTAGQVGLALRHHVLGDVATHIEVDGRRLPVVLRSQPQERESLEALTAFRVPGAQISVPGDTQGGQVRPILERIANVEAMEGATAIYRLNRERQATIRAELDGIDLTQARQYAHSVLDELDLPREYQGRLTGIHQVIDESIAELIWALLVGVALTYMVMAAQFESFFQPFVIMISVPLAILGALAALVLFDQPLSVPAMMGMVVLTGISVNNGIVMVDYINRLRGRGQPIRQAIVEGAVVRLRPILMTALTTIFGMLPLAFAYGDGSEFQVPMAISIIGGMITSTLLTLFLIPSLVAIGRHNDARFDPQRSSTKIPAGGLKSAHMLAFVSVGALLALAGSPVSALQLQPEWYAGVAAYDREKAEPVIGGGLGVAGEHYAFSARGFSPLSHDGDNASLWSWNALFHQDGFSRSIHWNLQGDYWQNGHEHQVGLSLRRPRGLTEVTLTKASGPRSFHMWSGRAPLPEGWHADFRFVSATSPQSEWERIVSVHADPLQPTTFLLLSGPQWDGGPIRAFLQGGLFLNDTYHPLARAGIAISLLPQGEVEVSVGPHLKDVPWNWPTFAFGFSGLLFNRPIVLRTEVGAASSYFDHRGYARISFGDIAFVGSWTKGPDRFASLGLQRSF